MALPVSDEDRRKLQQLEEALWTEETRFDRAYMEQVFAADFFEFGRSGQIHSREDCLSFERAPIDAVIPMKNFRVRLLTQDLAQVTYDSELNHDGVVEKGRRSSIWTRDGHGWQIRFHQGTPFSD